MNSLHMRKYTHLNPSTHARDHRYNLALLCRMKLHEQVSRADPKLRRVVALTNMLDSISNEIEEDLSQWPRDNPTWVDTNEMIEPGARVEGDRLREGFFFGDDGLDEGPATAAPYGSTEGWIEAVNRERFQGQPLTANHAPTSRERVREEVQIDAVVEECRETCKTGLEPSMITIREVTGSPLQDEENDVYKQDRDLEMAEAAVNEEEVESSDDSLDETSDCSCSDGGFHVYAPDKRSTLFSLPSLPHCRHSRSRSAPYICTPVLEYN